MSGKIYVRPNSADAGAKRRDIAKYFMPASTIRAFIPTEYRFREMLRFRATIMAAGALVTFLGISAMLLLTPPMPKKAAAVSAVVDRDAFEQHGVFWTLGGRSHPHCSNIE